MQMPWERRASEPEQERPLPADARRVHMRVVGRVQGVGFRWTCRKVADNLRRSSRTSSRSTSTIRSTTTSTTSTTCRSKPRSRRSRCCTEELTLAEKKMASKGQKEKNEPLVLREVCYSEQAASEQCFGWVAQLVEQGTENPCVGGSTPSPATTTSPQVRDGVLWPVFFLREDVGRMRWHMPPMTRPDLGADGVDEPLALCRLRFTVPTQDAGACSRGGLCRLPTPSSRMEHAFAQLGPK